MSSIESRTFTQAFVDCRRALNDTAGDVYTDAVLLPLGAQIHGELQEAFASLDRQFGEQIDGANFSYVTPNEFITIGGGVTDMYEPIDIYAKTLVTDEWYLLNRVFRLQAPPEVPNAQLTDWEWSDETIRVLPCSLNQLLRVRYQIQMPYPSTSSVMGVEGFYYPFVAGVCYQAARMTNRPQEASFRADYARLTDEALRRSGRELQGIPMTWGGFRPGKSGRAVVIKAS